MSKHNRDDVLASALLWCWEHKDAHDPSVENLEEWFIGALKEARKTHRNATSRSRSKQPPLTTSSTQDDTLTLASGASTADLLERALTVRQRTVLRVMDAQNWSFHKTARVCGLDGLETDMLRIQLKKIRDELPELREWHKTIMRRMVDSDDIKYDEKPRIDREIEALEFAPSPEKDCPPCWRCKWFEGWTPSNYKPTRLADAEVQTAVQRTEAEKIRIANSIGDFHAPS